MSSKRSKKNKKRYWWAVGRRKEAVVTVRLFTGRGTSLVNDQPINKYFPGEIFARLYQRPFELTGTKGQFYGIYYARGGGLRGQLDALILATARALEKVNREKYRPILKKAGLLTVDARVRERRKPGQMGRARKKKQSPKR